MAPVAFSQAVIPVQVYSSGDSHAGEYTFTGFERITHIEGHDGDPFPAENPPVMFDGNILRFRTSTEGEIRVRVFLELYGMRTSHDMIFTLVLNPYGNIRVSVVNLYKKTSSINIAPTIPTAGYVGFDGKVHKADMTILEDHDNIDGWYTTPEGTDASRSETIWSTHNTERDGRTVGWSDPIVYRAGVASGDNYIYTLIYGLYADGAFIDTPTIIPTREPVPIAGDETSSLDINLPAPTAAGGQWRIRIEQGTRTIGEAQQTRLGYILSMTNTAAGFNIPVRFTDPLGWMREVNGTNNDVYLDGLRIGFPGSFRIVITASEPPSSP